jgi:negative regulator of flagellin synthesis FlgM
MKIGPLENKPAPPLAAERPATVPAPARKPGEGSEPSAQVALSSAASSLMTGGEFDAEKVARIGQAIRDGSFKVNPEVIADKLIANAQELLGK